ncbi:MAG TPA: VWA domain-containing protein, partial [Vicinamibacterales bacterium]|nr:VWA domain-containing protein [Vicinamibacterales bacterium]
MRPLGRLLAVVATASTVLVGQGPTPAVRIVSPAEGAYITGSVRLTAAIEPASAVRQVAEVAFFADGHQVCTVAQPPFACEWDAGERLTEHQIRVVARLRSGERVAHTARTRGVTVAESVEVDVVQVTAVVTDGAGRFVRGLTRADFTVLDDGRAQPISHFAAENIPLELVAAIDVSSSMRDALPTLKAAAKRFLAALEPADQTTVLAFNENIFTLARRTSDDAARERAVDRMAAWGGTALYDAIIRSIDILGRQSGRRAVVVFSDGDDQSSHAALDAVVRAAEGSDATIYAIGQGRAVRAPALQHLLEQIASVSGGRAFFSPDASRLDRAFADILEDLRNQYVLSYPAPDAARSDRWHTIR